MAVKEIPPQNFGIICNIYLHTCKESRRDQNSYELNLRLLFNNKIIPRNMMRMDISYMCVFVTVSLHLKLLVNGNSTIVKSIVAFLMKRQRKFGQNYSFFKLKARCWIRGVSCWLILQKVLLFSSYTLNIVTR